MEAAFSPDASQFLVINSTKKYLNRSVIANTRRFKYIERI